MAQAAAGLHHAHNLTDPLGNTLGLVHRDVSPQNILLSFEGSVKVIDFGVARALGRITETQTGGMKGKFGYMSPEQARGEDLDLRADIFALGVVLWEAVTGKRLFQRDNDLATMRALIYDPIPRPSTVSPVVEGLESIIMRALARDPAQRFQTARDLANALERFVVQSGGASASDVGGVMKSHFAQDYTIWQQTIRKRRQPPRPRDRVDPGAVRPARRPGAHDLDGPPPAAPGGGHRGRPGRPRPAAGAGHPGPGRLGFPRAGSGRPGSADHRAARPPLARPARALRSAGAGAPAASREAPARPVLSAPAPGKSTRRKPVAPGRAPTRPKPPGGSDRRPNPF